VLRKYLIALKLFRLLKIFHDVAQNSLRIPRVFHVHRNPCVLQVLQVCGHPGLHVCVCVLTRVSQIITDILTHFSQISPTILLAFPGQLVPKISPDKPPWTFLHPICVLASWPSQSAIVYCYTACCTCSLLPSRDSEYILLCWDYAQAITRNWEFLLRHKKSASMCTKAEINKSTSQGCSSPSLKPSLRLGQWAYNWEYR